MMSRIPYGPDAIKMLAALLHEAGIEEIEIRERDSSIRMVRAVRETDDRGTWQGKKDPSTERPATATRPEPEPAKQDDAIITSPMVGLVYLAAEPGSPPLVTAGAKVRKGQVMLVLEAMKTFNNVAAPRDGTVTEILVTNGEAVEFGQPLIRLD